MLNSNVDVAITVWMEEGFVSRRIHLHHNHAKCGYVKDITDLLEKTLNFYHADCKDIGLSSRA